MRRIVVKVGSSSLTNAEGRIEPPRLWAIARALSSLDAEVTLVSSGAVAAGRGLLGAPRPTNLPTKQALAAVGQAVLMQEWARAFAPRAVAQFLLSAADIQDRKRFVNAKHALERALKLGVIPVINENDTVATQELRVGDNDTLSAWVAYLADAHELVLLTDVDALYTADPGKDPDARRIAVVPDISKVMHLAGGTRSGVGTGGMTTKLKAAQIAAQAGIDTIIIGGGGAGLERWASGADSGTRILAREHAARRGWIAHQPHKGVLHVDAGAAKALQGGRSLLPKGVTRVEGTFGMGDIVRIDGPDGPIAQGLTNYDSADAKLILGLPTTDIETTLGRKDYDELVHRNHLALL